MGENRAVIGVSITYTRQRDDFSTRLGLLGRVVTGLHRSAEFQFAACHESHAERHNTAPIDQS